ncbi:DNA metabolism protein [Enterobacteriaceae bacterium ENNIH1]|nr:DNA metabolism protein [Enterobacteriaceae bacterium ENNIH1]
MNPGSARNPHVLRVRCSFCALFGVNLPASRTPTDPD